MLFKYQETCKRIFGRKNGHGGRDSTTKWIKTSIVQLLFNFNNFIKIINLEIELESNRQGKKNVSTLVHKRRQRNISTYLKTSSLIKKTLMQDLESDGSRKF